VGQLVVRNGIFKRSGNMLLSYNRIKILGAVLACRNNKFIHNQLASYLEKASFF